MKNFTMRKSILILLPVLSFAIIVNSCKKGEDDPFFSFKTRKQRLVGEWQLFEGISKTGSYVVNYNGTQAILGNDNWKYTETIKFNGDGTFECVVDSDRYYDKCTKIGTWAFGPKDKPAELKAKEYVVIRIEDYTYYAMTTIGEVEMHEIYSQDACPVETIRLKELRSNEITIEMDGTVQFYYGNYDSSYVESYTKHFERTN